MNVKHKIRLVAVLSIIIGSGGLLASAAASRTPLAENASPPAEAAKAMTPMGISTRSDISNGAAEAHPAATADSLAQGTILIDHTCTDLSEIPDYWIEQAKKLAIHYAHTSHGSQINSGLETLDDPKYDFSRFCAGSEPPISLSCEEGALCMYDGNPPETYITPEDYWSTSGGVSRTQSVADTGLFDYSMWSWCGQQSSNPTLTVQLYLDTMAAFEADYPNMRFILMTGHTDGGSSTLERNNNMVKQYAVDNDMVLFDFADIEIYDPLGGGPYVNNGEGTCTWCVDFCSNHPEYCTDLPSSCAHSYAHPEDALFCKLKGNAFWWMMARLAGWEGPVAEQLDLIAPNGGESWPVNSERQIRWNTTGSVTQVSLIYSTDGFVTSHTITSAVANNDVYTWTTPLTPTTSARVRVESVVSPTVYDESDADFSIYDPSTFTNVVYLPLVLRNYAPPTPPPSGDLIQPPDLTYLGAFRLPDRATGAPDEESWEYSGQALTYRPDGDPGGGGDGYPGSLFGAGHDVSNYVSEIKIPVPGTSRNLEQLNVATTIQGFDDVRGGLFDGLVEMPRVGLQYLPVQTGQTSAKLYLTWGAHHQDVGSETDTPAHAWCDLDLSAPNTQGAWWIGDVSLYRVNGYIFEIPQEWAGAHLDGERLATGRYRDGGWSGMGPNIFAYGPWLDGSPPVSGTRLTARTVLSYSFAGGEHTLDYYHDSDEWEGGAWLTAGEKTAVVFVGTKGGGDYWWYGYSSPLGDGVPCPHIPLPGEGEVRCYDSSDGSDCAPELLDCTGYDVESKGWWSSRFDAQMIFYDPADFAAVLDGTMEPDEPQPYARLDIDEYLFLDPPAETWVDCGTGEQRKCRIGETAYDRQRGFLYVLERFADDTKPVVHVWSVQP